MTRTLVHHVWPAPIEEDEKNKAILPALDKIDSAGGEVRVVREGSLLAGMVKLPFLETPIGKRHYGVESIQRYAEDYRKN
ncbi:MAG: hypothetical protein KKE50_06320 [Nanoarchaeota archaeon]|nr:hypothetical protein [Nanoarchaeota archaeon]